MKNKLSIPPRQLIRHIDGVSRESLETAGGWRHGIHRSIQNQYLIPGLPANSSMQTVILHTDVHIHSRDSCIATRQTVGNFSIPRPPYTYLLLAIGNIDT